MPRAVDNLSKSASRVTLCALTLFVAGCDVEAPDTGAPRKVGALTTPRLLTGPEVAAASRMAAAEAPPAAGRAAALQARAAALQGAVLSPEQDTRLSGAADSP